MPKQVTRTYTINHMHEITIPWRKGQDRDRALAFADKVRAHGLPYTWTETETVVSLDEIDLGI